VEIIKTEYVRKIIENVGKALCLCGMNSDANLFIDSNRKLQHIIAKILRSYQIADSLVKREVLITPAMLKII